MDLEQYIHDEVVRQKSDKFDEFRQAYEYISEFKPEEVNVPKGSYLWTLTAVVQNVANKVEPDINYWCNRPTIGYTTLRVTEVGFANGGKAAKAVDVPHQFDRLMNFWSTDLCKPVEIPYAGVSHWYHLENWIKGLLQIHPFQDGNGRVSSILRNWMLGKMNDPEPLPHYNF